MKNLLNLHKNLLYFYRFQQKKKQYQQFVLKLV